MAKRGTNPESTEKQLYRLLTGLAALEQAQAYLRLLPSADGNEDLEHGLWTAFFISYTKPFSKNKGLMELPVRHIPRERRDLHRRILAIRNSLYGHIDPTAKLSSGEQLHKVKVRIKSGHLLPNPTRSRPALTEVPVFADHLQQVVSDILVAIAELLEKDDILEGLSDGDYEIDFTSSPAIKAAR